MTQAQTFESPRTIDAALALLAETPLTILAGGTDVYPLHAGKQSPRAVLDVTRISELHGIARRDGHWRIGAATTWTHIAAAELPSGFDGLKSAARQIGARQVQNAGTIAGNLCTASPAGDGIPVLLSLDASVELVSVRGTRTLPLTEFIVDYRRTALEPGEMVVAIHVPEAAADSASSFVKFGTREYLVISLAMVAVSLNRTADGSVSRARIAVGACSPVARRLREVEDRLVSGGLSHTMTPVTRDDLSGLAPIDDIRCSADYRLDLVPTLVNRALRECGVTVP